MKSVCILMSTYNGEKYLSEQLDSLLRQKYVNVQILIRDDGSKDNTLNILEEYKKKDSRINVFQGKNVGPAKSFLDCLAQAPESEYYAFCDQDDVWDDDKLIVAVERLEDEGKDFPALYYSNLRIVDQNLKYYRNAHSQPLIQKSKYASLIENLAVGCTSVFNNKAAELLRRKIPEYCTMHDAWLFMVCSVFGNVIYDFEPHISYRQHENNVVGTYLGKKTLSMYIERFFRLFNRGLQPRYNNVKNFYLVFKDILDKEDLKKVEEVIYYKKNIRNRIQLFRDKDMRMFSRERDISYRLLVLLGIA